MSFILKYSRVMLIFARQAEFAFRKNIFYLSSRKDLFKIHRTFVRSFALAPERISASSKPKNIQENLYQKSVSQVYFDVKYKGYIFREDFNDAWHSLKSSTSFTTEETVLLIRSCGHSLPLETPSERLKLVKEVWDGFDAIGIEKTIIHYNALLDVYLELEHIISPKDFLSNLEKQGLVPNLETYSKLLHVLGIQGNIGNSQTLLEHMKGHSLTIDDGVFNSLILGYSLQGDFISARGILELMKEKQLPLSSESYINLALGYAKMGDIENVKEIVGKCNIARISTTEFLELAYTFAVNKHLEHFSTILDMITLKKNFPIISAKVIHRLLHKNLDKEAFMLFEFRDKLESTSMVQEPIQMFLKHYVRFRTPDEVLNMTEIFKKKGWSAIALAFCLKETLIGKDVCHCLKFLRTMKSWRYPIRVHYFYPILVKSRPSGNEAVLKMIQQINSFHVKFGRETFRAFNHFYDFLPGAEFDDLEKLKGAGLEKKMVVWKILDILLIRRDIDNAIKLVSTCGVAYPNVSLPASMSDAFKELEDDYEKFVYILYYLIHNLKANKMLKQEVSEVKPVEYEQFIIEIVKSCSEKFILSVLEQMLNKKIPISMSAASFASKWFPSPEVIDLTSKLTSKNLKFEFDEALLNRLIESFYEDESNQEFSEKQEIKENWLTLNSALEKKMSIPDVMKIFWTLAEKPELEYDESQKRIMKKLLAFVSIEGDIASTEKIYKFGVNQNLINASSYSFCVVAHLVRGNLDTAIRRFYEGLKATKKCSGLGELIKEIKKKNFFLALEDLKSLLINVQGKTKTETQLLLEFARLGYVDEAKKIWESKARIQASLLNEVCQVMFKKGNLTFFETLEKSSRNITDLNMNSLYYHLVKLYECNRNLEKLLNLYVELDRDDALKKGFWDLFLSILNNWSFNIPEELDQVLQCIMEDCKKKIFFKGTESNFYEKNNINLWTISTSTSFDSTKDSSFNNYRDIFKCFCLIHNGKLDEYFELLRKKIVADGPAAAKDYFFCCKLIPYFMKDQKYFDKYEKLVLMCGSTDLWKKYLKLSLRLVLPHGINLALKKLDPVELHRFLRDGDVKDCEQVIRSEVCHRKLGNEIAVFYSVVINHYLKKNNIITARNYYVKANDHKLVLKNFTDEDLLKIREPSTIPNDDGL